MNNSIVKKFISNLAILMILIVCFSCTKEERSTLVKEELSKNNSQIVETTSNQEITPKYIINRRSGKVHSYTHGMNCGMSEHNKLESNENIEEILKNENYDICLNCFAGLKLNLDKYKTNKMVNDDDVDLTNREVNLIKLYMNMYEFGQLDTETQKFLICIFEVGSWYVHNVYTQLGGQKTAREVDDIAKVSASEGAYNKWRDYLDWYGKQYKFNESKKILPVLFPDNPTTDMVVYRCDLFKDLSYGKGNTEYSKTGLRTIKNTESEEVFKEWKNYCVIDDSSKFAAAVYYHYINKEILKEEKLENRIAYGIDLWETGSEKFSIKNKLTDILTNINKFDNINLKKVNKIKNNDIVEYYYKGNKLELKPGDLLYRYGNVEFYIGENKIVGWGRVQNNYTLNKEYEPRIDGYHSSDIEDKDVPYTTIIRFKGGE